MKPFSFIEEYFFRQLNYFGAGEAQASEHREEFNKNPARSLVGSTAKRFQQHLSSSEQ